MRADRADRWGDAGCGELADAGGWGRCSKWALDLLIRRNLGGLGYEF